MIDEVKNWQDETNSGQEIDFYRMYLDELSEIPACTDEEENDLLEAVKAGDKSAGRRLAEGNLHIAVKLAEKYQDRGLPLSDLVQEANMSLLLFVDELRDCGCDDFRGQMEKRIRAALEEALSLQESERRIEEEMAARVNVLKDISSAMATELGREATVEELAARMKMAEEEIRDIMKMTLDAMSVEGSL